MSAKLEKAGLIMPKATAVWLIENTALTFDQIGDFTGLHPIEVQALADGDIGKGIVGRNPVEHNELTSEELEKAKADSSYNMKQARSDLPTVKMRAKGPKYTPVSKRGDKPDAIAWLLKMAPNLSDTQIGKLIGTTKTTIQAVKNRTHETSATLKPRSPVLLGLCTQAELDDAMAKARKRTGKPDPEPEIFESEEIVA